MKNIVKINNADYIKNISAFKVRNKWTPLDNLEIDNFTGRYELKIHLTSYSNFDNETKYTSCPIKVHLGSKVVIICINEIIKDIDCFVVYKDHYYFLGTSYDIPSRSKFSPSTKVYSVDGSKEVVEKVVPIENNLSFLSNYTFGIELETTGSSLKPLASAYGFYELYDGSISGPEYASRVLRYDNFHTIEKFMAILNTLSSFNGYCSLHIHVGNIEYTSDNLCAIYSLFQRLQEDLNLLIAPYKKDYNFLYGKQKDHCKNLPLIPDINENSIMSLFKLDCNEEYSDDHSIHSVAKWNLDGRYYAVNFLNYICKDYPNNTIEIRSLQMTNNYDYFLTWLIINVSIIDYAIKNTDKILNKKEKIQVEDCLVGLPDDILKAVLTNYKIIKNKIYSLKYLHGNLNPNLRLDTHLALENISPPIIKTDKTLWTKLNNIKKSSPIDGSGIYHSYSRLPGLTIDHGGGWTYPTEDDCYLLLRRIKAGVLEFFELNEMLFGDNYFVEGGNILNRNGRTVYHTSLTITHFVVIENYDITYTAVFNNRAITVSTKANTDGFGEDMDEI